eukprot:scaffold275632_cov38-Prasinocladus_malaysianus.AAC.1
MAVLTSLQKSLRRKRSRKQSLAESSPDEVAADSRSNSSLDSNGSFSARKRLIKVSGLPPVSPPLYPLPRLESAIVLTPQSIGRRTLLQLTTVEAWIAEA